ncbi:MAG: outer membrane beta-barrel protein [Hyphomicrobium sp.]
MAFRVTLFLAFLAAALPLAAAAQSADPPALRGAIDDDDPMSLLPDGAPAPPVDATVTGSVPDQSDPATPAGKVSTKVGRTPSDPAVDTSDPASGLVTGAAVRRVTEEDDPYAATGIRIGSFIYYPSVTVGAGFTSNANAVPGSRGSPTLSISPELFVQSDWARHEATLRLSGSWEHFTDGAAPDDPTGEIAATARLDLADRWNVDLAGSYGYSQQSVSDPNFPVGATDSPAVHTLDGSITLNGALGRNEFAFETRDVRTTYDNASAGGVVIAQHYRDNNLISARLRYGYELSPVFTPFVEGELNERIYGEAVDPNGVARSSHGFAARVGIAFDDSPIWKGEIALGTREEHLDDPTLAALHALTVDGSLVWSPTALTTVTADASTAFNPSTIADSPGSVVYEGSVDLAYAYRRNLTFDLTGSLEYEHFVGLGETDWTYSVGTSATWKLNRRMQLKAGYLHEWLQSNVSDVAYTADSVRLDLTLQR